MRFSTALQANTTGLPRQRANNAPPLANSQFVAQYGIRDWALQTAGAMYTLDRIVSTPGVVSGMPRIKGTRVTVGAILGQLAVGHTVEEILREYPYIQREDVLAALQFAAWRAQEEEVELSA